MTRRLPTSAALAGGPGGKVLSGYSESSWVPLGIEVALAAGRHLPPARSRAHRLAHGRVEPIGADHQARTKHAATRCPDRGEGPVDGRLDGPHTLLRGAPSTLARIARAVLTDASQQQQADARRTLITSIALVEATSSHSASACIVHACMLACVLWVSVGVLCACVLAFVRGRGVYGGPGSRVPRIGRRGLSSRRKHRGRRRSRRDGRARLRRRRSR